MTLAIEHLNQLASLQPSEDQAAESAGLSVGLWVPSEQVLVFRLELPKVSRRKQQEMLPWLLEDRLLSAPDDFEFILGAEVSETESLVYVIDKSLLGQWMLLAEAAAVVPEHMAPDFLALPYEEGRWTLYTEEGRLLVRTGLYEGFAADLAFGWQQLELLRAQQDKSIRLSHLAAADVSVPDSLAEHVDTETGQINWSFTELPTGLDLLPAAYRPKSSSTMTAWMPAMVASVLLLVVCLSYMLLQSWAWQRDAEVLQQGIAQTYEALFSERLSGSSIDAARQASEKLQLMEHQYIVSQTSPLAELAAVDRIFSTCSDCVLLGISQTASGLDVRLKDNERVKSRMQGLEGWSASWQPVAEDGTTTLSLSQGAP